MFLKFSISVNGDIYSKSTPVGIEFVKLYKRNVIPHVETVCLLTRKQMQKPLRMSYLRCFQGFIYFLMVGKVIDLGCVLRIQEKELDCTHPCKCSFALRVQPFSKRNCQKIKKHSHFNIDRDNKMKYNKQQVGLQPCTRR